LQTSRSESEEFDKTLQAAAVCLTIRGCEQKDQEAQ
jgi:hypothetical protein